ncbi:MAG TPA: AsnC family transcriptional regulator [Methylomusa anaerophila]|nr:AsnC family transcriptional regulator [Methylomusa anaerophila]HML89096.1 AsnC family transcriptional regulator [Methylomusa anaerophila]
MLTDFDKHLLNYIQTNLPLTSRPFAEVAKELGTDETTVLERLAWLKSHGYIRRIGPFFDSARLGYVSTLAALKAPPECIPAIAAAINRYPGITHNYEREGEYNLWFTLLTADQNQQEKILDEIRAMPGVSKLLSLPAIKKYKVSVEFQL